MKFQKSDLMTNVKCQVSQIDFGKSSLFTYDDIDINIDVRVFKVIVW